MSELENQTPDTGGEMAYERVALESRLLLRALTNEWCVDEEAPHITSFKYDVFLESEEEGDQDEGGRKPTRVGTIDGYILSNDGSQGIDLWDEADALDADIEAYVTCLDIELKAIDVLSGLAPELPMFPRVLIVRHFAAADGVDSIEMIVKAVAAVAMKEGPSLLVVDPRELPEIRKSASGKLKGRTHTAALMQQLGLVRMVSCRCVWGWHPVHDLMSNEHSYAALVAAKAEGKLDDILNGLRPDEE